MNESSIHSMLSYGLSEKIAPDQTCLVVVDMQNEFCSPGNAYERAGLKSDLSGIGEMTPRLVRFVRAARRANVRIALVRAVYCPANGEDRLGYLSPAWLEQARRTRPRLYTDVPVCQEDSWGVEFIPGLSPEPGDWVITKHRLSAFVGTDLASRLRAHRIKTVLVTGVGTCGCVDSTARDAFMQDFNALIVSDCASIAWQEFHDSALREFDHFFGEVRSSEEILNAWREGIDAEDRRGPAVRA